MRAPYPIRAAPGTSKLRAADAPIAVPKILNDKKSNIKYHNIANIVQICNLRDKCMHR